MSQNGVCVNNMPGYTCMCDEGFQIDESGTECIGTICESEFTASNCNLRR